MSDSYQPFYQDFDSLTGMLGQILGLRAADSAFTPHAGRGMPEPGGGDTGDRGGGLLGLGGEGGIPPNMSGMLDMVRGSDPMGGNLPLDPSKSIGAAGQPNPAPSFPPGGGLPPLPPPMEPFETQGGGVPPVQKLGSDAASMANQNPMRDPRLQPPGFDAVPPPFMPGTPNMLGGEAPGAPAGATPPPGAMPPPEAVPLPPPRPPGAPEPGALPPAAAPVAQPLTPPAPRENPLETLKRQLLGDTGQPGRPQRGGNYDNPTRRLVASLGAGMSGLDKHPGSKFGAFAGGAGKAMSAGAKTDAENRAQDEKEASEQFKEDDTIYKRMVHDPFDLMQKQINISKGQAQTDLLNARRDATVNGKPGGVNSKMWNDPFGRQVMADREIARVMAEKWKTHRSKWDKVTNMNATQRAQRQADEDRINKEGETIKADMYKQYKIDHQQAEKNKTIGESKENPFNPIGMGLTKQEFEKLVPPGKWYIPKEGAEAVPRAGKSVMENAQDLAGDREKDVKGQRDNQLNPTEEQELYQ
jgi:hypothetical protein